MFVLQINFGEGWQPTCYRPMNRWDAYSLAERLGGLYTSYQYRVVSV